MDARSAYSNFLLAPGFPYIYENSFRKSLMMLAAISDFIMHCSDVIMITVASQITIVYSIVYSENIKAPRYWPLCGEFTGDRWIHRWPVNSPHKGLVTRKMFPFDDVIMLSDFVTWSATFTRVFLKVETRNLRSAHLRPNMLFFISSGLLVVVSS